MGKENMKKVFMILLAAVLLLFVVGVVPGVASATEITNVSEMDTATTNVVLDLENKYKVTIPPEIRFVGTEITKTTVNALKYTADAEVKVDVTLLPTDHNITVNVSSSNFNTQFNPTDIKDYGSGAWRLNSTDSEYLHYVISTGSSHLGVDGLSNDKTQYVIPTSSTDNFIRSGDTIVDSPVGVTVPFHIALVEVPTEVKTYQDTLSFTVDLKDLSPSP